MPLFLLFPPPFCQRVFWNACDCYLQRSKTHESIEQLEAEIREALRKRDLQAVGLSPCPHRHPPLAPVKKEALGPVLPKVFSSSSFFVPPLLSLSYCCCCQADKYGVYHQGNPTAETTSEAAAKMDNFPSLPDSQDFANQFGEEGIFPCSQNSLSSLPTPPLSQVVVLLDSLNIFSRGIQRVERNKA